MNDRDKQHAFAQCVGQLLGYVGTKTGWQVTFGDAYRDPRVPYGHRLSCHRFRLAVDFNLFVDGEWITDSSHPAWVELGNYWESLNPLARWGGKGSLHPIGLQHDGNHFSFTHQGVE